MEFSNTREAVTVLNGIEDPAQISEKLRDLVASAIREYYTEADKIVQGLSAGIGDRVLLLIDAMLGYRVDQMRKTLRDYAASNIARDSGKLVLNNLFDGRAPMTNADVFASWMPLKIEQIRRLGVEDSGVNFDKEVALVGISGSPANLHDLASNGDSVVPSVGLNSDVTNKDVYQFTRRVITDAVDANLMRFGICYGHQLSGALVGGKIELMESGLAEGMKNVDTNSLTDANFNALFGPRILKNKMRLMMRHKGILQPNPQTSLTVLRNNYFEGDSGVGAVINSSNVDFHSENPVGNLLDSLDDGKTASFGVQSHPEQNLFYLLNEIIQKTIKSEPLDADEIIRTLKSTLQVLAMSCNFLTKHPSLNK